MSQVIQAKIRKLTEIRTDSSQMLEALSTLASFYDKSEPGRFKTTIDARRELRSELEHQSFLLAEEFLASIDEFRQSIREVEELVEGVGSNCKNIKSRYIGDPNMNLTSSFNGITRIA